MEYVKQNWTSKVYGKIRRHKFISMLVGSIVVFSIFNGIMIYQFLKMLQNM